MPFSSQFALSLEVTRLIPLGHVVSKAAEAVMNVARELRHSGSDIVTEEDLTNVFGRSRIASELASSFKTITIQSAEQVPIWESITLQAGPGPTVMRALREPAYFSMVVQLSFLTWTCEAGYLATALVDCLRRRLAGGAQALSNFQTTPDRASILEVLQACERQTAAFNWNDLLHAVAMALDYPIATSELGDVSSLILQGALDMFPMVQSLPEDRFVHIQVPKRRGYRSCVSAFVVWAHHILGLSITVQLRRDSNTEKTSARHFGSSASDQILIEEVAEDCDETITLLDAAKETLLAIELEPGIEYMLIGTVRRFSVKGWGTVILNDILESLSHCGPQKAVVEDLQHVVCAFAMIVCEHLVRDTSGRECDIDCTAEEMHKLRGSIPYTVKPTRLLDVSRILFNNPQIRKVDVERYKVLYSKQALDGNLHLPLTLEAVARKHPSHESLVVDEWHTICNQARLLCIFLISLANIENLEKLQEFMLCGAAISEVSQHELGIQLIEWQGYNELLIQDHAWLQAFAIPLLGHLKSVWTMPWDQTCLVSDRGWSAWISTFSNVDPSYTEVGSFSIGRGSPCRNGVWKTGVRDLRLRHPKTLEFDQDPEKAEECGQLSRLRCARKVDFHVPFIGESDKSFVVDGRLKFANTIPGTSPIQKAGFKELHTALWWARHTQRCPHGSRQNETVTVPPGCCTIEGFGNQLDEASERIIACLTAHCAAARWLALVSFPWTLFLGTDGEDSEPGFSRQMLLRGHDCCFQCAIDQAAGQSGRWLIVL